MLAFAMLEEVVDAPLFPQTLQERPVALEVLTLNVPLRPSLVRPRGGKAFFDRERIGREHRIGDLDNGHILKDSAVTILGRMPEPRPQRECIDDRTTVFTHDRRMADDTGDLACARTKIGHSGTPDQAGDEAAL